MKDIPIGRLVSMIHRENQKYLSKAFKEYEIGNGGQYAFLKTIIVQPGINQDELSTILKFDKATTARAVKQLEKAGYIDRKNDENDRRVNKLFPTDKASNIYPAIQAILNQLNKEITKNLTEEEEEQLINLLIKISEE